MMQMSFVYGMSSDVCRDMEKGVIPDIVNDLEVYQEMGVKKGVL